MRYCAKRNGELLLPKCAITKIYMAASQPSSSSPLTFTTNLDNMETLLATDDQKLES